MSLRALFGFGFFAFLMIGALQAIYGPAFTALGTRFGVGRADIGLIASAHFLGSMLGIMASGAVLLHSSLRRLLRGGAALLALGLATVAFAPSWPVALLGALVGGLGFGGVSVTFNVSFARLGERSAGALNLVNAMFGLGSVLAPLLVVFLGGAVWPYVLLALASLVLLLGAGRVPQLPEAVTAAGDRPVDGRLLALFGLLFVTYVGVEAGLGSWMTTHLQTNGFSDAAAWTSAFWLTVTVGRLLGAPLSQRVPLPGLVTCAALLAALVLPLAATVAAPLAYLVAGLAIAPIFASSLAWFSRVLPSRFTPLVLACGGLGGTLVPALLGILVESFGTAVLPYAFAVTALGVVAVACAVQGALRRVSRMLCSSLPHELH
ncbi:MFS transporter [Deinococcus peraridilitoris]|uniref:MFS transporter n=1 Tax=Deinococcus peraridilitoris TaxID=432329 RepID=UPI0012F7F014|nr:MFS transporter [Deinococcus peraridilitoris]